MADRLEALLGKVDFKHLESVKPTRVQLPAISSERRGLVSMGCQRVLTIVGEPRQANNQTTNQLLSPRLCHAVQTYFMPTSPSHCFLAIKRCQVGGEVDREGPHPQFES